MSAPRQWPNGSAHVRGPGVKGYKPYRRVWGVAEEHNPNFMGRAVLCDNGQGYEVYQWLHKSKEYRYRGVVKRHVDVWERLR